MDVKKLPGLVVLTIDDAVVDVTNAQRIEAEVLPLLNEDANLILDLVNVQFVDSSGLGKVVSLAKKTGETGKRMGVCNVNQSVMVLFNMVKLHQIVSIFPDPEEAIRALSA